MSQSPLKWNVLWKKEYGCGQKCKKKKKLCCINISNSALWEMGTKDEKFNIFFLFLSLFLFHSLILFFLPSFLFVTKCKPTGCLTSSNDVSERITWSRAKYIEVGMYSWRQKTNVHHWNIIIISISIS